MSTSAQKYSPQDAYGYCLQRVKSHYENFPVASLLLPRKLRMPIAAIYAFARSADDIADEGDLTPEQRLEQLQTYADRLDDISQGNTIDEPIFIALRDTIERFDLPLGLFHDLLDAFRQDVVQQRYASFTDVLDYCRRSANPVGRLLLYLDGSATEANLQLSDQICSALQLINFLQDILQDYTENNRIYFPLDEMRQLGISENDIGRRRQDEAMYHLFHAQVERTRRMMLAGSVLGDNLSGRFGLEIRLIIQGGLRIVERLSAPDYRLYDRPRLRRRDALWILARSLMR